MLIAFYESENINAITEVCNYLVKKLHINEKGALP
jgi:hypothetical protein